MVKIGREREIPHPSSWRDALILSFFPGGKLDFNLVTKKFHDQVKEAYNVNMYAKKGNY